ncbi:MAG: Spy/CpxP family protein refolding chaperone [Deltaproteobacteria bacterium]|nr:Spy/CpxP family protein refolding chaperone [Deltaproteobacteria bacterium]
MRKTATIIGILVLVAAIAIPVFAHDRGWGKGRGMAMVPGGMQAPYCCNIPNLTPEQSAKLTELRQQHDKEIIPLRNELTAKHAELRNLWVQGNPDEAAIKAKQQEINDLRNKLQDTMTEYRLEVGKILTPEQRAQLQSARPGWDYRGDVKRPGARGYGRSTRTW